MDMAAILLNGAEPFEQIVNIPLTVKIDQAVSEKKTLKDFKDFKLFYTCIYPRARAHNPQNSVGT